MANPEHLEKLKEGVAAWNQWRAEETSVWPDLSRANLSHADLSGADFSNADLSEVTLLFASLMGANLNNADLSGAHLLEANLIQADLSGADLSEALLYGANLCGATLVSADLSDADLRQANLVDARLDRANLAGARLWETQRGGWSIKGVACQRAFWDREGNEPTEYTDGEFERLFAEKPRIVLRYRGSMSPMDLITLPVVVEGLRAEHPDSVLQIRSIQNDAGGASVTITVEDLKDRGTEALTAAVDALRAGVLEIQHRLGSSEKERLEVQAQIDVLVKRVIPELAAAPKQQFNFGPITAPLSIEGLVMNKGDTYNVSGQAGVVGPSGHAHDMTFQQIQGRLDLPKLAEELGRLRNAMNSERTGTREEDKAIGAVADAEEAAAKGDGSAVWQHLKSAGTWTLKIAEKIGVELATEALKKATMGQGARSSVRRFGESRTHVAGGSACVSARHRDPPSASKSDPIGSMSSSFLSKVYALLGGVTIQSR